MKLAKRQCLAMYIAGEGNGNLTSASLFRRSTPRVGNGIESSTSKLTENKPIRSRKWSRAESRGNLDLTDLTVPVSSSLLTVSYSTAKAIERYTKAPVRVLF